MARWSYLAATPLLAIAIASCDAFVPACPETFEQADSGAFRAFTDDTLVFTGWVIRYVDSPELEARGYDLDIRSWLQGVALEEASFLRVTEEVPGIRGGQAVLIIAEQGDKPQVLVPGTCVPLLPISEDQVEARARD